MNKNESEEYDLRQLFEQITIVSRKIKTFSVDELWKWTKFNSINSHLNRSLVIHKPSNVAIEKRKEVLNKQSIYGNYLLFDFVEHLPEFAIIRYNNFEELIEAIISQSGILNHFTTLQIPIIKGVAKDILFVLKYTDKTQFEQKIEKEIREKIKDKIIKICEE